MTSRFLPGLLVVLLTWAPSGQLCAGTSDPPPVVTIDVENQERMGIVLTPVARQARPVVVSAYVRAVDVLPLLSLVSELETARAAVQASAAELARLSELAAQDQSAAARDVEGARSAALADRARLDLLERRLRLEWSVDLARRIARSPELPDSLSRGEIVLLRADAPDHAEGVVGEVAVAPVTGTTPLLAEPIGLSGSVDVQLQTIGLFALARPGDGTPVRPGRLLDGEIRTSEILQGFLLPRSALIRVGESRWVYVQTGRTTFQRRSLSAARPMSDGWFVSDGFETGDRIVAAGAGSLLAVEQTDSSPAND